MPCSEWARHICQQLNHGKDTEENSTLKKTMTLCMLGAELEAAVKKEVKERLFVTIIKT